MQMEYTTEKCSGVILEKVCEYLYYKDRYENQNNVPDMDIAPELSLELALAADFLDCMTFILTRLLWC